MFLNQMQGPWRLSTSLFGEYNSLIQVMNYLNALPRAHMMQTVSLGYRNPILQILSQALCVDFSRYQTQINSKTILEELQLCQANTSTSLSRSKSLPVPPKPQISTSYNAAKSTQKNRPSKNTTAVKSSSPKIVSSTTANTSTASVKAKNVQKQSALLSNPVNSKKKIHKVLEGRRQNASRVPQLSLLQTAEIGRSALTEKEKRRMRERLLIRRIRYFQQATEIKQNRRELRTQH